jgi:hypothetical protein
MLYVLKVQLKINPRSFPMHFNQQGISSQSNFFSGSLSDSVRETHGNVAKKN